MTLQDLKLHIKDLPALPGVYMFKDAAGKNLYIGKAFHLKNRVKNYLVTPDLRIKKMIEAADRIEHKTAANDIEALIMESLLIKENRPPYNIVMRDDKQYSYVIFTKDVFLRIYAGHQPSKRDDSIGPFTDAASLKTTLRHLRRIFPYCTCKQQHNNYCLNYHIGKCPGFCCLKNRQTLPEEITSYRQNTQSIKKILSGKKSSVIKDLKEKMKQKAAEQDFESAMKTQIDIERLERVFDNTLIIRKLTSEGILGNEIRTNKDLNLLKKELDLKKDIHRIEGYDISNIQGTNATGAMVAFENGFANKNQYRKFKIKTVKGADDTAMLKEVLIRRMNHPEWPMPDLILIDGGKGQLSAAKSIIKKIPIIALTKNEKHFGHKILINGKEKEISLSLLSPNVRNLILTVDTEAHRFAINYYRTLHGRKIKAAY